MDNNNIIIVCIINNYYDNIIIIMCNVQRTFRQWLSSLFTPTSEGQVAAQDVLSSKYYYNTYRVGIMIITPCVRMCSKG